MSRTDIWHACQAGWNAANYLRPSKGEIEGQIPADNCPVFPLSRWDPSHTSTLPPASAQGCRLPKPLSPATTPPAAPLPPLQRHSHWVRVVQEVKKEVPTRRNWWEEEREQRRRARRDWNSGVSACWPELQPALPRCASCPYQPFGEWPVPGRYTKPAHRESPLHHTSSSSSSSSPPHCTSNTSIGFLSTLILTDRLGAWGTFGTGHHLCTCCPCGPPPPTTLPHSETFGFPSHKKFFKSLPCYVMVYEWIY